MKRTFIIIALGIASGVMQSACTRLAYKAGYEKGRLTGQLEFAEGYKEGKRAALDSVKARTVKLYYKNYMRRLEATIDIVDSLENERKKVRN